MVKAALKSTNEEIAQGWHQTIENMRQDFRIRRRQRLLVAEYKGKVAGYINVYPDSKWGAFANLGYRKSWISGFYKVSQ